MAMRQRAGTNSAGCDDLRRKLRELRPVRVASTGSMAQDVLNARLLALALGGGAGVRQEAAEFNVAQPLRRADWH